MKNKTLLALLIIGGLFSVRHVTAQAWLRDLGLKKATSSEASFYDVQKAFYDYWDEQAKVAGTEEEREGAENEEEGKGWEQFKRWENFMEPRVFPYGNLELPSIYKQISGSKTLTSLTAAWEPLGPFTVPNVIFRPKKSGAGRINSIAFHPTNPDIMWVGAPSGGIWKTTNGGTSWETTSDELASIGVSDIVVNPLNPKELYIVTGDGDAGDTYSIGILKSFDSGETWIQTGVSLSISDKVYFRKILMNPSDTSMLLATSNNGIYRSLNGFSSAEIVQSGNFKDLEFKPGSSNVIYASKYDVNGNAGIYRSTNSGQKFSALTNELNIGGKVSRIELAVTPANPNVLFALASSASDDGLFGLYKSTNSGLNWTTVYDRNSKVNLLGWELSGKDLGGQGWYDLSLAVSPVNENIVLTGGVNIWRSSDGGSNFSIAAHWIGSQTVPYVHADQHMFRYNPVNQRLYSCNDGGVYYSANNGTSWKDISDGLTILQIYRSAATNAVIDLFLSGNQDNGSMMRSGGDWNQVTGGDGMECAIDPANSSILYTSYYNGNFYKSIDGGNNFTPIGPPKLPGSGAWITPFALGTRSTSSIYTAYSDIYKSPDGGKNWLTLSENLTGGTNLRSMAIAPSDNSTIYTATYNQIWVTRNGGITWDNITHGLPQQAFMSIDVAPNNPEKVWLAVSGFADGEKVYRSSDGGLSWENYSDGLPNLPCNVIKYKYASDDALYLGTDVGVFYRDNTMNSWQSFTTSLPNVIINDLDIQYPWNRLIAGSYGRGLWASPLYAPPNETFAYIHAAKRYACQNDPVTFSLETGGEPDSVAWDFNGESFFSRSSGQPVQASFTTPGIKNITAIVYYGNVGYVAKLTNFLNVVAAPELLAVAYGTSSFHTGDEATILAFGADSYSWVPAESLMSPDSSMTLASPSITTDYIVTGTLGSCTATDTVTIEVQPGPENDDVCSAIELEPGRNGPYTNLDASVQPDEPYPDTTNCNTQITWCSEGGLQNSVWFTFEAVSSSSSFVTSGFDTQIALYSANACQGILDGNYSLIAANDDFFGSSQKYAAAIEQAPLEAGKRYWIQVDGSGGGDEGTFYINIYDAPVGTEGATVKIPGKVNIYPNPGHDEFNLEVNGLNGNVTMRVFSLTGAVIMERAFQSSGTIRDRFNLSRPGVYIVSINSDTDHITKRLIVE